MDTCCVASSFYVFQPNTCFHTQLKLLKIKTQKTTKLKYPNKKKKKKKKYNFAILKKDLKKLIKSKAIRRIREERKNKRGTWWDRSHCTRYNTWSQFCRCTQDIYITLDNTGYLYNLGYIVLHCYMYVFASGGICPLLFIDDAEKFTSEMHDPCARGRCLQERTTQNRPRGGTGVGPAKHPPKVKSEMFLQL